MSSTITIRISDDYLEQIKALGIKPTQFVKELTITELEKLREAQLEDEIAKEAAAIKAFDQKFSIDFDNASDIIEKDA
ncbi:hypothetical protein MY04_4205 [Flammeovirga sp. MY04]|uniref:hypothetical protein n=1 Tax=Flammeovirga sp. MY04 TaxID=1191459 RepID=UPI00080636F9|nr:hypothetical protein [Flammeovirga sp. MY04]ANQ51547.1 hypothetical protein MY04_4205 [Flammeovirga sp. MY04]